MVEYFIFIFLLLLALWKSGKVDVAFCIAIVCLNVRSGRVYGLRSVYLTACTNLFNYAPFLYVFRRALREFFTKKTLFIHRICTNKDFPPKGEEVGGVLRENLGSSEVVFFRQNRKHRPYGWCFVTPVYSWGICEE